MERAPYMNLLRDNRWLAGNRLKSPTSMHGEASQLAKGLFPRAGGKGHCACIAHKPLGSRRNAVTKLIFCPQEAQLSPNMLKVSAETFGC